MEEGRSKMQVPCLSGSTSGLCVRYCGSITQCIQNVHIPPQCHQVFQTGKLPSEVSIFFKNEGGRVAADFKHRCMSVLLLCRLLW